MKKFLVVSGLMLVLCHTLLPARQQVRMTRVYMAGFSASFTDSAAFVTGVQTMDSTYMDRKTHFLIDRHMYSAQLYRYLQTHNRCTNPTCVVFFGTNRQKVEKKMNKIAARFSKDPSVRLTTLDAADFRFENETYVPPTPEELKAQEQARKAARKADKHRKAEKR